MLIVKQHDVVHLPSAVPIFDPEEYLLPGGEVTPLGIGLRHMAQQSALGIVGDFIQEGQMGDKGCAIGGGDQHPEGIRFDQCSNAPWIGLFKIGRQIHGINPVQGCSS